jgi:hypothetical protein
MALQREIADDRDDRIGRHRPNPPVTPASISVIGSASMTVKWAKDSGRIR